MRLKDYVMSPWPKASGQSYTRSSETKGRFETQVCLSHNQATRCRKGGTDVSGGCPDQSSRRTTTCGRPVDTYPVLRVRRRGTMGAQLPTGGGDRHTPPTPRPSTNLLGRRPDHHDKQQGVVIRPDWITPIGMPEMRRHALGDVPLWPARNHFTTPTRNQPPTTGGFDPALFVQLGIHVAEGGGSPVTARKRGRGGSTMRPPRGRHRPPHIGWCHQCCYSGHGTKSPQRRPTRTHSRMGVRQHGHCSAHH